LAAFISYEDISSYDIKAANFCSSIFIVLSFKSWKFLFVYGDLYAQTSMYVLNQDVQALN
jgi:hypothetical protein